MIGKESPRVIPDGEAGFFGSPVESIPVDDWKSPPFPGYARPKIGCGLPSFPLWEIWSLNLGSSTSLPAPVRTGSKPSAAEHPQLFLSSKTTEPRKLYGRIWHP